MPISTSTNQSWNNSQAPKASVTVLGVDPGLQVTGYAVVRAGDSAPTICEAGILRTDATDSLEIRLKTLYDGLDQIISEFSPNAMAVEQLYSHYKHPQTAVVMGHARGTVFLVAANYEIPDVSYAATRVKKSLTGNGRASKLQVQRCITDLMKLPKMPKSFDVTDAIAVAICHIEAGR